MFGCHRFNLIPFSDLMLFVFVQNVTLLGYSANRNLFMILELITCHIPFSDLLLLLFVQTFTLLGYSANLNIFIVLELKTGFI